jgi:heme/copper-type cytochrome/quinol oxidase subunit 4
MDYERYVDFAGEPKKAIEVAQTMFVQSGYRIVDISNTKITAEHEGGFIKSISANTIYGASPVTVAVMGNRLIVSARYDGIKKTKKFILYLLVGLAFLLGLGLGLPFAIIFEEKWPMILALGLGIGIPLIQIPIHLFVTPMIMKKRAEKALDILIHNITMLAR